MSQIWTFGEVLKNQPQTTASVRGFRLGGFGVNLTGDGMATLTPQIKWGKTMVIFDDWYL